MSTFWLPALPQSFPTIDKPNLAIRRKRGGQVLLKMKYLRPSTKQEALFFLNQYGAKGARVIAGGTDLLMAMRSKAIAPKYLIDLADLRLDYIVKEREYLGVGAMCTFNTLAENELVKQKVPVLIEAANQVGAVQTRHLATIGGNLCSAVPSCDSAPALMVLGAKMSISGPENQKKIPIEEFFLGPRRTILALNEILTEIEIPIPADRFGASFMKFGRRKALTLAVVNAAASIALMEDQETAKEVTIALGAVAPTPIRAHRAEKLLVGKRLSETLIEEVAAVAASETSPISDLRASADYRRQLSKTLVKRTLLKAWERAKGDS